MAVSSLLLPLPHVVSESFQHPVIVTFKRPLSVLESGMLEPGALGDTYCLTTLYLLKFDGRFALVGTGTDELV